MRGYQTLWWSATCLLSALGVLVALQALPGLLLLLMVLYLLTIGGQIRALRSGLRRPESGRPSPAGGPAAVATALAVGAAAAVGATALLGLMILLGWAVAVPLGLLLAASSPGPAAQYRTIGASAAAALDALVVTRTDDPKPPPSRDTQHVRPKSVAAPGTNPTLRSEPDPLSRLTVDQLCRRWRCSYLPLQSTADCTAHVELVQQRQLYLDELERRQPDAFARWLSAGAQAASDPSPYFSAPGVADR